jgi:hypothetical protein
MGLHGLLQGQLYLTICNINYRSICYTLRLHWKCPLVLKGEILQPCFWLRQTYLQALFLGRKGVIIPPSERKGI